MAEYLPLYFPGDAVPVTASTAIIGGTLITWAGATAGAGATNVAGVAAFDQAIGSVVTVYTDGINRITAAANVTAGALVKAAAGGQVTPYVVGTDGVDQVVGRAIAAATTGNPVPVKFTTL